jgi:hypothetical protein
MTKLFNITLQETVTKTMVIEAESKESAEMIALNFHLGWSDKELNSSIRNLSTSIEGTVFETPENLSKGSGHSSAVY